MLYLNRAASLLAPVIFLILSLSARADSDHTIDYAIDHAPIGVMGDHYHKAGEWMLSARYMRMDMRGNQDSSGKLSDAEVLNTKNVAGNMPMLLSIVPDDMQMGMLMIGGMYAPSDDLTLMLGVSAVDRQMASTTYSAANSMAQERQRLGRFQTSNKDIANLSFSALIRLQEQADQRWHMAIGLRQSMASADATDTVLTPMNMRMVMRLPYAMQVGDESLAAHAALTHVRDVNDWRFGAQISGYFNIAAKDWHFGDEVQGTLWSQRSLSAALSLSARITVRQQKPISGRDALIAGPVQAANPENYGGTHWDMGLGANYIASFLPGKGNRLAIEVSAPLKSKPNGVQMRPRSQITFGWQKAF